MYLENLALFSLSIENSPESMEGSGHEQMMLKLENKASSAKFTQIMHLEHHKEPYNTTLETCKQGMWQLVR